MDKKDIPECFGEQGAESLYGDPSTKCLDCEIFDKCHKITVTSCLQSLADNGLLLIRNAIVAKKLLSFKELCEIEDESEDKDGNK